jgi:hypothetical protein
VKRILAAIITMLVCFTACEAAGPKPPIELPFEVYKAGATVTTELWIVKKGIHQYLFGLEFEYNKKDKSENIWKLVGSWEKDEETGKSVKPGIMIPLKIKIKNSNSLGGKPIFEKEILLGELDGCSEKYCSRTIGNYPLTPGHYNITIQSLRDIPELANTNVIFTIHNPRRK